jgi:hypothetical protein
MEHERTYTAFAGDRRVVAGGLRTVVLGIKQRVERGEDRTILVFDDHDGSQIDFDLRGSADEVLARLAEHPAFAADPGKRAGPGRPKLGVVCREVSLLPRHWSWLEGQPGGISVALRKLIDDARRRGQGKQLARTVRDGVGKFMWTMAGNLPDFEDASRALFAGDHARFKQLIRAWPEDIRDHLERRVDACARLEREATDVP